ncbi:hypothetical protein WR25_14994 [Diploscapter pachys]|uniref:C2H2-type domain-containing protein n=1 Tax=Diploscapter pachys TaxID=2018661 RepID=A0A2A2M2F4_9BILA|nr:hypothetical protein WR25_14994 [Diploscapter pachys]
MPATALRSRPVASRMTSGHHCREQIGGEDDKVDDSLQDRRPPGPQRDRRHEQRQSQQRHRLGADAERQRQPQHQANDRDCGDRQADRRQRRSQREVQAGLQPVAPCRIECRQTFRRQHQSGDHHADHRERQARRDHRLFDLCRQPLGEQHDDDQRDKQDAKCRPRGLVAGRRDMRLRLDIACRQEIVAVPHRLHQHERAVEDEADHRDEDQLRGGIGRPRRTGRVIGQDQRQDGQRRQRRQRRADPAQREALLAVHHPAGQQAQPDDEGQDDHDRGEHRVARQRGHVARSRHHQRHD